VRFIRTPSFIFFHFVLKERERKENTFFSMQAAAPASENAPRTEQQDKAGYVSSLAAQRKGVKIEQAVGGRKAKEKERTTKARFFFLQAKDDDRQLDDLLLLLACFLAASFPCFALFPSPVGTLGHLDALERKRYGDGGREKGEKERETIDLNYSTLFFFTCCCFSFFFSFPLKKTKTGPNSKQQQQLRRRW